MRAFIWTGLVVVVTLIVVQGWLMGFVPPPAPSLSPEEIKAIFVENKTRILAGAFLKLVLWSLYANWACAITMFIRQMERSWPLLTYTSIALIGAGLVFFLLVPMTWAVIAFRAETLDPSIVQIMNDWVWFDWLFTWPPFTIWMFLIAIAILRDHNVPAIYPRWVAYFNIWSGLLIAPAGMIGFFKIGPFAYNGIISFWEAAAVFFGWMVVMSVMTFRVINEQEARGKQTASTTPDASLGDVQPSSI